MARRGGEAALKRAREKARQEKQEAKREKRQARSIDDQTAGEVNVDDLMEEFAQLGARFEANQITEAVFVEERHRIFTALGIASEEV